MLITGECAGSEALRLVADRALIETLTHLGRTGRFGELNDLERVVHARLRAIAAGQRRKLGGGASDTLNTTALVNEAYLKLSRSDARWRDREHFFALCANAMRQILVDAARARQRQKRAGQEELLNDQLHAESEVSEQVIALNEHLDRLHALEPRLADTVSLKFFLGMTNVEIAELREQSAKTVQRDWVKGRAWLRRELAG